MEHLHATSRDSVPAIVSQLSWADAPAADTELDLGHRNPVLVPAATAALFALLIASLVVLGLI